MSQKSDLLAREFMEKETQFHLGFLPTEQSSPLTRNLDREFARATVDGVANLQSVDRNVLAMAERILKSAEFQKLLDRGLETIRQGGRIVFSGCGATGRLSILLESMWRRSCDRNPAAAKYADCVASIMTGGDFALVRSVEFFEDYQVFGRRQVADLGMTAKDMLVAITEGGETSSVLGTVFEALDRGCAAFLMFNNPAKLLAEHLERSRKAIEDPRVCVLDLSCGPMALAGSTRMQATTSEQLIAGAALETIMDRLLGVREHDYAAEFADLLQALESKAARQAIAGFIDFETNVYRKHGLMTYYSGEYLLDIFTDTTERSPTFMLPPFRKCDDHVSPRPWSFVKNPVLATPEVWKQNFYRPLRCLEWTLEDYRNMQASDALLANPPAISGKELMKIEVGKEDSEDRWATGKDAAVAITTGFAGDDAIRQAWQALRGNFAESCELAIGQGSDADFVIPCALKHGSLELMTHMLVKLALNTISTGVMASLGRVTGNWMSWVAISNKKLIDRAIRLISEIGGISYEESALKVFAAAEELEREANASQEQVSVVQYVLKSLKRA